MLFNEFAEIYKRYTNETISRIKFSEYINHTIIEIDNFAEIIDIERRIAKKVINGMITYIKIGRFPHGINKEDIKITIDVMKKIKEKYLDDPEEKNRLSAFAEMLKSIIDMKC